VRTGGLIRRRGIAQWMEMAPPISLSLSLSCGKYDEKKEMNSKYVFSKLKFWG